VCVVYVKRRTLDGASRRTKLIDPDLPPLRWRSGDLAHLFSVSYLFASGYNAARDRHVGKFARRTRLPLGQVRSPATHHRPLSHFRPWLQMQKVAQSTSSAFKVAQSRFVSSLTVCHFEPKKWHTLSRVARPDGLAGWEDSDFIPLGCGSAALGAQSGLITSAPSRRRRGCCRFSAPPR
jgi:hypothetical protein